MYITEKEAGILCTEIANKEKELNNKKKVCICGKLDPMASGKLLLLFDNDCKLMDNYLSTRKVYTWDILWGIKTDTDDGLGLIEYEKDILYFIEDNIKNLLEKYKGNIIQKFHNYSSIYVKNKYNERMPLWKWSLNNRLNEIKIPEKNVNIKYINLLNTKKIYFNDIKNDLINTILKVKGNFRQDSIIKQWNNYKNKEIYISSFECNVSSGFYIRQLVKDIGNLSNYYGMTLNIYRKDIII